MAERLSQVIEGRFDPTNTALLFLRLAVQRLSDQRLTIFLHRTFEGLADARGGTPLMPNYDPRCYAGGEGFWLEMVDEKGDAAGTEAGRLYRIEEGSIASLMSSLEFYYNPVSRAAMDEACLCTSGAAARLRGKVWFGGALWVRPDLRGRGFGGLLTHICRVLAHHYWDQDFTFAVCEDDIANSGVVASVGYKKLEPGIIWTGSESYGYQKLNIMWMDRAELNADIASRLALREAA